MRSLLSRSRTKVALAEYLNYGNVFTLIEKVEARNRRISDDIPLFGSRTKIKTSRMFELQGCHRFARKKRKLEVDGFDSDDTPLFQK